MIGRALALALATTVLVTDASGQKTAAFTNGLWFTGSGFERKTMYVVAGELRSSAPGSVDTTIDLGRRYVIPPFGEAHNHNIEGSSRVQARIDQYLAQGIFYIKNPNSLPSAREVMAGRINTPASVDVVFAHGGVNATDGHPTDLVKRNIARGVMKESDAEGAFYHTIDDAAALEAKWPRILAGRPDFIKTYLLVSEEYAQRRSDTTFNGFKGLDPTLLPEIVQRAHAAGLRVTTHIETAADFRHAVAAGVDELAHMPGYGWPGRGDSTRFELTEADARAAAGQDVVVVTTLRITRRVGPDGKPQPEQQRREDLHRHNLQLLKSAGVRIAVGSDNYGGTAALEAMYLSELGVFNALELLKLWAEVTPLTIFPARKIGRLQDGFEASFLVLEQNPLDDFSSVLRIGLRVKQGQVLR